MIKLVLIILAIIFILKKKLKCKTKENFYWRQHSNYPYYLYNPYYHGIQYYYKDFLPDYIKPYYYIHPLYGKFFLNTQYQHYKYPFHTRYLTRKVTYPNK